MGHQLLYINSLFYILYKIITLKKQQNENNDRLKADSLRSPSQSFMELLKDRRKKKPPHTISGGTAGPLSTMDAVYMSDSETIQPKKQKLKKINHEKNILLELFLN